MPIVKAQLTGKMNPFTINRRSLPVSGSIVGWNLGLSLGGPGSMVGDDTSGIRHMNMTMQKNTTEGSPNSPCLEIGQPGFWRFRWVVKPGQRRIAVRAKQVKAVADPNWRPSMVIKANRNVGLNSDVTVLAPAGMDWVLIGPYVFTATGTDVVYVELHNNLYMNENPLQESKAFFDHIIVT
jgi:hypothetical protein